MPDLTGLLIHRRAGFDELKRHHDLFVAVNKRLVLAWSDGDGPGPTWSTVVVSPTKEDGSQDILSFRGFHSPSDADPDRLRLFNYHWMSTKHELIETQPRPEVSAVIAGTFDSVSKARAVQAGASCLSSFWVLESDVFSKLTPGKFVLAAVTTRKELADTLGDEVRSCTSQRSISIVTSPYRQPEE